MAWHSPRKLLSTGSSPGTISLLWVQMRSKLWENLLFCKWRHMHDRIPSHSVISYFVLSSNERDLQGNQIRYIHPDAFRGLHSLQVLWVTWHVFFLPTSANTITGNDRPLTGNWTTINSGNCLLPFFPCNRSVSCKFCISVLYHPEKKETREENRFHWMVLSHSRHLSFSSPFSHPPSACLLSFPSLSWRQTEINQTTRRRRYPFVSD